MTSIRLIRGAFGHVSLLDVTSDLVTHAHAELHLVINVGGASGTMTVGGQCVCPGPGVAIGVNSFEPHSHSFRDDSQPGRFLNFYIDPDWLAARHGAGPRLFRDKVIPLDDWLRKAVLDLLEPHAGENRAEDLAEYEVERLIDCLIDAAAPAQVVRRSWRAPGDPTDYRLRKALIVMEAHISRRMGLDELARSVGLSRPHFFALFKEHMKLTPNVYWNTLRMEEAQRQLEVSEESLTMVACNLGFTSQSNFTRFFRDHSGVTPTIYREASRAA
ncbi:MAG: AraC family transcriptional regulator [Cereibacter sphaeroides]|uniref:AraC family transcriptional regulator n=1 Tax=Cereibacter sphaeroides TaxID=1063 RepID=A0A2W5SAF1_CERSP|nr:MAG: AraC family transcriptional regulator [Cereibacter sphaeroides]